MSARYIVAISMLALAACGGDVTEPVDAPVDEDVVVASNYPLYFFASRIVAGVDNAPQIILPDIDGDPSFWTPTDEQILLLQRADAILLNGAGAEPWIQLITLDERSHVDTSAGIDLVPLEEAVAHQHGPEGEHAHDGTAFTTWLDPRRATKQATVVSDALVRLTPENETAFLRNLDQLLEELTALDVRMADVTARLGDRPVFFSHPVYQYLERRYGINGESVHWEPGEAPSMAAWIEFQQKVGVHPATLMIWEDEPLPSTIERLAGLGIQSVVFHTAANRQEDGEYLAVMRANADRLDDAL